MVAQGPMGPVCVGNSLPIRVHYYAIKKLAALACHIKRSDNAMKSMRRCMVPLDDGAMMRCVCIVVWEGFNLLGLNQK